MESPIRAFSCEPITPVTVGASLLANGCFVVPSKPKQAGTRSLDKARVSGAFATRETRSPVAEEINPRQAAPPIVGPGCLANPIVGASLLAKKNRCASAVLRIL